MTMPTMLSAVTSAFDLAGAGSPKGKFFAKMWALCSKSGEVHRVWHLTTEGPGEPMCWAQFEAISEPTDLVGADMDNTGGRKRKPAASPASNGGSDLDDGASSFTWAGSLCCVPSVWSR